jgi:hypothetical protein
LPSQSSDVPLGCTHNLVSCNPVDEIPACGLWLGKRLRQRFEIFVIDAEV